MLKEIIKIILPFYEFTSICDNLDESEVKKFYNLDKIEYGPSCIGHVQRVKVDPHMSPSIMDWNVI